MSHQSVSHRRAARSPRAPRRATGLLPDAHLVEAHLADIAHASLLECATLLRARRVSSVELTDAFLRRIAACDPRVDAYVRVYADRARAQARHADRRRAKRNGGVPLLCGIPVALKDMIAVAGLPVTAGSRVLAGNVAPGSATAWARLEAQGMVLLGHTQTHEFGFGSITPQTANPWDPRKTAGGSSGGCGAALAARMAPGALGTDTGGSVRNPASLTGTSAIKPTFGRVSTHGVIPLSWTLDHVGVMAEGLGDAAALLQAIAGPDPADPATLAHGAFEPRLPLSARPTARPLAGLRIGFPVDGPVPDELAPGVAAVWERFRAELRRLGAKLVPIVPPHEPRVEDHSLADFIALAELEPYHAGFHAERAASYSASVRAVLDEIAARQIRSLTYLEAQRERARIAAAYAQLFQARRLDAYVLPTVALEPPDRPSPDSPEMPTLGASLRGTFNLTGSPVAVVPTGLSAVSGMPTGMQIVGAPGDDRGVIRIGLDYQAAHPYHRTHPLDPELTEEAPR